MNMAEKIASKIEARRESFIKLSDQIWEFAETNYTEFRSSELLARTLEEAGFAVNTAAGNIPTAFTASYGTGSPVIAILGEYDALFYLSQEKGIAEKRPIKQGGNGHGCGHNLLGTAGVAAVMAVQELLDEEQFEGTIRYYGCPAEEGGAGKVYMMKAGLFDDVDIAITWHPSTGNRVISQRIIANNRVTYKFKGRSSHAGASPHLGRSALDAVELMNIASNYLREHLIQDTRLHYAITNAGGCSPNVVQQEAEVQYVLRGPNMSVVQDMVERVTNIATGAALMTGTTFTHSIDSGTSDLVPNKPLELLMYASFQQLGVPQFDQEEESFAELIRSTFSKEEKISEKALADTLLPYEYDSGIIHGSSDVGDVSWSVPTAQCVTACFALDTPFHTWQIVSQGTTSIAHKGMLHAGKVMGLSVIELFRQPKIIAEAKAAHAKELQGKPYICPIPDGVGIPSVTTEYSLI
ncbi:amidohydrolase [Neobacillus niacini]|uniref:amidohydrolase n=1 Tax=Neobacillus niacini TaxID=86668 RepID=UPI0005EDF110|nr:amidohydrolase [Neobacillus niacini]